ncbi:hypothetical protein GOP47_0015698 [Adiantum capillus-veneris]|uniref:Pectate lyase superfamily protein domain-containing protein n=1 Tax=Adiantum capillus-veneris TaxID=13818 RepID=A0A9D4ZCV3_ADICA|nr:hypothetical protein GOP47_0015698 [Adiantum capillus-veneris]
MSNESIHCKKMRGYIHITTLLLYYSLSITADCARFSYKEPYRPRRHSSAAFQNPFVDKSHGSLISHLENARALASSWWQDTLNLQNAEESRSRTLIFNPGANGADPTGNSDSTAELQLTINQAFEVASRNNLMPGVADLGGVEVHLAGGQYAISKPLTLPDQGGGNVVIRGGTLRATSSFPSDRFLIELGSPQLREEWVRLGGKLANSHGQPAFENIALQNLMLDANFTAGGILLLNPIRTTIANCYITHFSSSGISVHGGHETFIQTSFLGQHITTGSDPGERSFSGTAILLDSNDNAVTDVVIFSAQTAIEILGQANIITGVHCYNKATGWGGVGIMIRQGAAQNRMLGCYLDYTGIVLEETRQITITNSFFLGDAFVLLRATGNPDVVGLSIVDNMFSGGNHGVPIVQTKGSFSHVKQTCVDDNSATGMALRSTRARVSVAGFGSNWTADLSETLLFPTSIAHVQYSFFASNENATDSSSVFPSHALQSVKATSITVASDIPVHAIVSFNVDQSTYSESETMYVA